MVLQATLSSTPNCFCLGGISRPIIPLKIRPKTAAFASSSNSSSKPPLARSVANVTSHQEIARPLENFSPDLWGDHFITLPFSNSEFESCLKRVEVQKEKVKDMLMTSTRDPKENIYLINSLSRLGISYHFENEIDELLGHLFITLPQFMDNKDYDLHTITIIFQVFRSHGYKMSCDVFNKFKNSDGMFKEELASNIKEMISLYEASHWGVHGEVILDEALAFTRMHLESFVNQSCPDHLREYIKNALYRPYHKGMAMLEARQYISFYEKDHESRNDMLLKLAKYDFNMVQMHLQHEISVLSSWYKKSKIDSKFPRIRQRIVESYVIGVGAFYEPRFALARSVMTKWFIALILLDDTYDAYGLYEEELQYLTKAMLRFDRNAMEELPGEHIKSVYETILNVSDEVEEDVSKVGRSFSVSYVKEEVRKLVRAYHLQAKWTHEHTLPPFDEYLENGRKSIGMVLSMALVMMGIEEADEDAFQWLANSDAISLRAMSVLTRLYNDQDSNEDEEKRGGQVSGITCYMKEYKVSREEAFEGYKERIRDGWKDLNEGFLVRPTSVPWQILKTIFNFTRTSEVYYKDDNGFTKPEKSFKDYIVKILIDPISIQE